MDISETIQPKSDQQNYEDYLAGPKTVTVSGVSKGSADQPVNIELKEYPGRPFKPSKTARRVLVAAWGSDASQYVGRRMTLFGDPTVKWAGEPVGGIRISHLSHLEKPITVALTVTRGKRQKHTVQPLKEASPPQPAQPAYDLDALDVDGLRALYMDRQAAGATPDELAQIQAAAQRQENKA